MLTNLTEWRVAPTLHWMEAFETWLKVDRRKFGKRGMLSEKSVEAYLQDARHFSRFYEQAFGQPFSPDMLTVQTVQAYFKAIDGQKASPATYNRRLVTLRLVVGWAQSAGLLASDPTDCIERKDSQYEPRDRTPDEMDALEAAAAARQHLKCRTGKHGLLGIRDEIIFLLCGLGGGLRISEVAGLDVEDVNTSTCQIRVRGKGGTDQRIEVSDELIEAIGKWLEVRPGPATGALLTDWSGKRLTSGQLRRRLKMIGASARVELTPHDLRATFGCQYYSSAIRQTGSEYAAGDATRRQMRHKDFRTTQKNYLRASRAQIRAALKGL